MAVFVPPGVAQPAGVESGVGGSHELGVDLLAAVDEQIGMLALADEAAVVEGWHGGPGAELKVDHEPVPHTGGVGGEHSPELKGVRCAAPGSGDPVDLGWDRESEGLERESVDDGRGGVPGDERGE